MPAFNSPYGRIYFEQRGSRSNVPILLIHGLGCQLIHWPDSLLDGFVNEGFRVIVFDNRDVGLSFGVDSEPPSIAELIGALNDPNALDPAYSLADMAADAVRLLDHIGQSGAHVVGVSMGGMIAQRMAIAHSKRVFSLTVLMSSTGNPDTPNPAPEVIGAMANSIVTNTRQEAIEASRASTRLFGGPHYDSCEVGIGRFAEQAFDRASRPDGVLRQLAAILSDGDRRELLSNVTIPTLAIHGEVDPLVDKFGSQDIVSTMSNSRIRLIEQLGHDLPEPVVPTFVSEIVSHIRQSETTR